MIRILCLISECFHEEVLLIMLPALFVLGVLVYGSIRCVLVRSRLNFVVLGQGQIRTGHADSKPKAKEWGVVKGQ